MQDHLGGCQFPDPWLFVPDIWADMVERFSVSSVLDVGCGPGYATKWFSDNGCRAVGIEGWQEAISKSPVPELIIKHDYTTGPIELGQRFDLCWCAEFVEHVEAKYSEHFIASFAACRVVTMTHAVPGQGGYHHVNEQPEDYWIDALVKYGLVLDGYSTAHYRSMRHNVPYGINHLLIFNNTLWQQKES